MKLPAKAKPPTASRGASLFFLSPEGEDQGGGEAIAMLPPPPTPTAGEGNFKDFFSN